LIFFIADLRFVFRGNISAVVGDTIEIAEEIK